MGCTITVTTNDMNVMIVDGTTNIFGEWKVISDPQLHFQIATGLCIIYDSDITIAILDEATAIYGEINYCMGRIVSA